MTTTTRLDDLVSRLLARLEAHRTASLPLIEGAAPRSLARLAWSRAFLPGPMVEVDPTWLDDPPAMAEYGRQAYDGWLVLLGPVEARVGGCAVLRLDPHRVVQVSSADLQRLRLADQLHGIAADPALAPFRQALGALVRTSAVVCLHGPPGVGKRELVHLVHAESETAARLVTQQPAVSDWLLIEEISRLDRERRDLLAERLTPQRPRTPSPPVRPGRPSEPAFTGIIGESPAMVAALREASRAASAAWPVLLVGETGTGKRLLAKAIHEASGRVGPLAAVDLTALPEELVEGDLLGQKVGGPRLGAVRAADGGTLLVEEIGRLPPRAQRALAQVLQERAVRPVGQKESVPVDIRLIATSSVDPDLLVARGLLRDDLRRQLDAFVIPLPPLRERGDDVVLLARAFLGRRRSGAQLTASACDRLRSGSWPGNVRSLQAMMARAAAQALGDVDGPHLADLAPHAPRGPTLLLSSAEATPDPPMPWLSWKAAVVTMRLPSLRERDPDQLRALILAHAEGHPIRTEALEVLVRQPWWGNLPELRHTLTQLREGWTQPIDLARVRHVLPGAWARSDQRPIEVLLAPVIVGDRVDGVWSSHAAGAVVLGRVGSTAELQATLAGRPERKAWLDRVAGDASPACVPLRMLPEAGRVQAVVTRAPEGGLVVHAPGWSGLVVHAGPVGGAELTRVYPSRPVHLGEGGELQLVGKDGQSRLQLFVLAGPVAREELVHHALVRVLAAAEAPELELLEPIADCWVLDRAEARALVNLVATHPGGELLGWISHTLKLLGRRPELVRLTAFLRSVDGTDPILDLFAHEGNEGLIPDLRTRLQELGDPESRTQKLPARLQDMLRPG